MRSIVRWVVVVCAAAAASSLHAQNAPMIAGAVFDDRAALAVRANFVPVAGVTVRLWRDGGDRTPSIDDASVATTRTNEAGHFVFHDIAPADYWVAIDSRTLAPNAWPEQTFGPAGSLCAQPDGTTRTNWFEGSCFGGRTISGSDDASAVTTAEHLALVSLRDSATRADFAFSFDAVTSTADGERVQGSLRQFVRNANAVGGPNRMRFVPLERAREQREPIMGVPPRWWTITLTAPLPELTDGDTVIDGTAYNFLSPASMANMHPGRRGEPPAIKPEEMLTPRLENPELELTLAGETGIVCASRCGIRAVAMHGTATGIIARADARIEHVLIGTSADGLAVPDRGAVGLQIESGTTAARHLLVSGQLRAGIIVAGEGRIDGERLEVERCGDPQTGGGIILLSNGSSIRNSVVASNPGAGIIVGSPDGSSPASGNTIDGCTISANQAGVILGAGSSRNNIVRNDIMWNRLGGVASAPFESPENAPRENRVSANRFDENGLRPIVLDLGAPNPNELSRGSETCERIANAANGGISAPRVTGVEMRQEGDVARVIVRGRACPGEVVEIYQSFVTSGVRDESAELPRIRGDEAERETLTTQRREIALPSIGEFNYVGSTNTAADGTFEAAFPLPLTTTTQRDDSSIEETRLWASDVLRASDPRDRAYSAIAIDSLGNTSEMSVRRKVD